ncbi:hypothetical protein [Haladaptatus sp. CMAA 1911]|uniref:hypothetical protein n=1 Tax=unclassified Haladaptatus TaxID=2622732 RepID=UPI003754C6A1
MDKNIEFNRRDYLKTAGMTTAAMSVAGCAFIDDILGRPKDSEHVPFTVWEELRAALQTSPDHLPARATRLVTTDNPDPEKIFRFVRDEIVTYPDEIDQFNHNGTRVRWGIRGTLRGGAGTPREKAELLADLYRRAGWTAEVLIGDGLDEPAQMKRLLWQPLERQFAPQIDEQQIEEWHKRLDQSAKDVQTVDTIDEQGRESRRLANHLLQQVPSTEVSPQEFDWESGALPVVRVVIDGDNYYADLFDLDSPFGESRDSTDSLEIAPDASETLPVEVTLSAVTADDPEESFELVSGTWSADELVGRQLLLQTLPGIDPFEQPTTTFRDIQTFIPALTMQAVDLDTNEPSELSVTGDAVTRAGDRLHIQEDGTVSRNGEPFVRSEGGPAATDVSRLDVTVDSGRFPEIRLNIHAIDKTGKPVEQLPATAFRVTDEQKPVGISMTSNQQAPRVVILSDTSLSMPIRYLGDEMSELVTALRSHILSEYPNADVRHWETNSDLWTYLDRAAGSDANLIVYATDGHVNDELSPEIETALQQGPPAIMLSVFENEDPELQRMADLTGGVVKPAGDHAAAQKAVIDYLEKQAPTLPTYTLTYGSPAPMGSSGERHVRVSVADSDIEDQAQYMIPSSPALPPHLAGLYLTVTIDKQEITRTLAGYDPVRHEKQPVTQEMIDEVTSALFGSNLLSFEAAAPAESIWLDDLLTAKLSVDGIDQALIDGDEKELNRQLDAGFTHIPPELCLLTGPLPEAITDHSLTFHTGLRVTLYQEYPVFDEERVVQHVDLLPFANFATAADDPQKAFELTIEKTARLAIIESELFKTSTRSLLADKQLDEYGTIDDAIIEEWGDERADLWDQLFDTMDVFSGSDYQLVPTTGAPFAFWNIDEKTGELLGVLPDQSGGGSSEEGIRKAIREIDRIIYAYNILLSTMSSAGALATPGAFAIGIVAAYGQTLARLYGAASLAIAIMDTSSLDKQVHRAIAYLACNVARAIIFAGIGEWIVDVIDNLLSIAGTNPTGCPG